MLKLLIVIGIYAAYCWYMDEWLNGEQEKKKDVSKNKSWF